MRVRIWSQAHPTPLPHAEDGPLRSKQLRLLLDWAEFGAEKFEADREQSGEVVTFSVLLGDLNFDNCSKGTALSTSVLHHSVASSPKMPRRALEQEKGRHLYLAGPPGRSR
nr:sphingomyelin phosphodiesterase 5-like [Pongo pygmaeus]